MTYSDPMPYHFYHADGRGGVHESDLIECTPEEWAASAYSADPDWSVIPPGEGGGGMVRALRLPAALRRSGAPQATAGVRSRLGD